MTLRIWHQSMTELTNQAAYTKALERHIAQVVDADAMVDLHGVRPGTYGEAAPSQALSYPFGFHTLLRQVLDLVLEAEESGCHAVALASFAEPFLREARSIVDIPVVSMAESSLLTACSVARRSALVSVTKDRRDERHGRCRGRAEPRRGAGPPPAAHRPARRKALGLPPSARGAAGPAARTAFGVSTPAAARIPESTRPATSGHELLRRT
ncbi:aspartate/glutamate racemase family protein [Streptomyces sp. NBC_00842]|uniref:aspartate/glutamate racemase family protein n=1 Tax=Streptomyces sp. NBC_00842 TaxID=2975848 RepID=UPI003866BD81|nr:aspartate/glutamate racemase family protein [Streptomyces sp. NBC_00842]